MKIIETIEAGANAAVDLTVPTIETVREKARELLLHIETAGATLHLTNAVSAITAIQYMEAHFMELVAVAKAEATEIETKVEGVLETAKNEGADVAGSIAAATAASVR
ncbi:MULTISPECIES: hypothetical protein [Bradyrhizobium]|uniref:Uncharacterized protein n=1 Tax=Bradyrhizobium elkanii TaxID=29448 RepID=A0A8I1Y6S7_BRAEL|nr:hypothetical protein [Bradyrhizobium elkanii]MBP1294295.1 hypothetical protein [Bradyrhizobium elkanii]